MPADPWLLKSGGLCSSHPGCTIGVNRALAGRAQVENDCGDGESDAQLDKAEADKEQRFQGVAYDLVRCLGGPKGSACIAVEEFVGPEHDEDILSSGQDE